MIHILGDSHVALFSGQKKMIDSYPYVHQNYPFQCYRLGPYTATGINWHKGIIYKIIDKYVQHDEWLLLSFGEVDIRAHLSKLIFFKDHPFEDVGLSVDEYMKFILKLCEHRNGKVGVIGVPPSHCDGRRYDVSYGNNLGRNHLSRIWNNYLQKLCERYQIPFPCVFDEIILPDGLTNPKYMDGWVHLNQKAWPFMNEELKKFNLYV